MGIKVEKSAEDWFFTLQQDNPEKNKVLEVGLKAAGCSGFEYTLKWLEEEPENFVSTTLNQKDKTLSIGYSKAVDSFLDGMTLRYEKEGISYKLVYDNPHVDMACGCGASVNFK